MRQGGQADVLVGGGVEQLKVLVQKPLVFVKGEGDFAIAGAFEGDSMSGRVDVGDSMLALDGSVDGKLFQGTGGLAISLERIDVFDQVAVLGCDAGVGHG